MKILIRTLGLLGVFTLLSACGGTVASNSDAGADVGMDAEDGSVDGGQDAGQDAAVDAGADAGQDAGQDASGDEDFPLGDWLDESRVHRVRILLQPHSSRERVDLPVLARVEHEGAAISRAISVFEIRDGLQPEAVPAGAWSDPDGRGFQVGFEAPGLTPVGAGRTFELYFQVTQTPPNWSWQSDDWAERSQLPGGVVGIHGACCEIMREVDETAGTLRGGRRSGQATSLRLLEEDWRVAEGYANDYQLQDNTEIFEPARVESRPFEQIHYDGDAHQAAWAAAWSLSDPLDHRVVESWRLFRDWPFAQFVLAVDSDTQGLSFSSNDWNARQLYLTAGFDRMISDVYEDQALASVWNTGMRWLVAYDSASGRGFGWLMSGRGVIRADGSDGSVRFFDSYGYSAGGALRFEGLWMAAADKDAIIDLFDAMKPGARVGPAESRDLNILEPGDGDYFFPGDELRLRISTPGSSLPVTAHWSLPDASRLDLVLQRVEDGRMWQNAEELILDEQHEEGEWTLVVESGDESRQIRIHVQHPHHPHLLFSAVDLDELRARKDGSHAGIWTGMLAEAQSLSPPISDPGPGRDIRAYAERLINLALIQLVDPTAPHADMLWQYFFSMLRYPNWTDPDNPFNNLDLTVGHFLTALALTYDWHYDALSPDERRELRARLAETADRWLDEGWLRHYPDIDWTRFGTVTNNHYWINHGGVAAAAFALAGEVDETRRQRWVERCEANRAVIFSVLQDDGASNEGVAYHSYGQINLFPWLDMRDRALGGQSASAIPWFGNSILTDLYAILPGGDDNYGGPARFGDCPPYHYNPPRTIQAWLAGRLDDGVAQWMAENLDWPRQSPFAYLWYDPGVQAVSPESLPNWHLAENRGIFVWRSSWANDATYFSLKAGSYFGGHEQPDAGHFVLHRAGVPYLCDLGYSYWKMADEHNLLLVNGAGQFGQDRQWMGSVDPANWARILFHLGDADHFHLLADPRPMVDMPDLQRWEREVLGLGPDLLVLRDDLQAATAVDYSLLLHSYCTDAPAGSNQSYDYLTRRLENPFQDLGTGYLLAPREGAAGLHVQDCSAESWQAQVEPSFFVPEQKLDEGGYNEERAIYQLGFRLNRSRNDSDTSSLVALWFGDSIQVEPLSSAAGEGLRAYDASGDLALILWSFVGTVGPLGGLSLEGAMGGVRRQPQAHFGRDLTRLERAGQLLLSSSAPIRYYARLEDQAGPRYVRVQSDEAADLSLYCPEEPSQLLLDGTPQAYTWNAGLLEVQVSGGEHLLSLDP